MGTACDHMDTVRTQLPYALLVGAVAMAVGDVPTALGMSPWISYAVGAARPRVAPVGGGTRGLTGADGALTRR